MHGKALELLKELSAEEEDMEDILLPSIQDLQHLGPKYFDLDFKYVRWIDLDSEIDSQVCLMSEEVDLRRKEVEDYLEGTSPELCAKSRLYHWREAGNGDIVSPSNGRTVFVDQAYSEEAQGRRSYKNKAYERFLKSIVDDSIGSMISLLQLVLCMPIFTISFSL
ncbi:hypothetical protein D9613_011964 [Agrocybe pediades]|uniref:Uncharacterized protein n=1 Tax=Agrocybe pediades TaxID=84607 RepID=A0A8H4VIZ5_9AGAR|nr:hypothetical protein D9613_011964 [Agrocybe pediades]